MFFSNSTLADEATSGNGVLDFFKSIVDNINYGTLLYVFAGIMLFVIVASAVGLLWSYEERAMRNIRKINNYLSKHPTVDDGNIVAFNTQMKKLPRRIRDRWQLYMLERDGSPSRYLNIEYCVKRPLNNSAFLQMRNQMRYISVVLASVSLLLSLVIAVADTATTTSALITTLANCAVTPCVVLATGFLYTMILQLRYKYLNTDFYDIFTNFTRNVDKASATLPDYVDYELLFTKKEIDSGIPVLREYLEKKALEEQRLLEKARRAEVEHSPYDFDELGVNGQQLIERAVSESENFLLDKIDIQTEINRLEKQKDNTTKNMEDIEREANKKLQAINENLDRLDKEMAEKTNKVEINFTMGQIKQERDKKATLEKDLATRLEKEKIAQDALNVEIQKRKEKIDEGKRDVEVALKAEYNTFAGRLYDEIYQKVVGTCAEDIHKYQMQIDRLKNKLLEFDKELDARDTAIKTKDLEIENLKIAVANADKKSFVGKNKRKKEAGKQSLQAENTQTYTQNSEQTNPEEQNLMSTTSGVADGDTVSDYSQYYDEQGNAIDYSKDEDTEQNTSVFYDEDGNLIDYSQYYDEFGNLKPEYAQDEQQQTEDEPTNTEQQPETQQETPVETQDDYHEVYVDNTLPQLEEVPQSADENDAITTNDLLDLQKQIAEENKKLNQQREELRTQIDQTLSSIEPKDKKPASKKTTAKKSTTKTAGSAKKKTTVKAKTSTKQKTETKPKTTKAKQTKQKNIVELTRQIDELKQEVKTAKAHGASDEEVEAINKRIVEILKDIANYKK